MREKLIYQCRYPRIDYKNCNELDMAEDEKDTDSKPLNANDFYKGIYATTQCTPIPKRVREGEEFIRLAIEISKLYQIDTRITQRESHIKILVAFDYGINMEYIGKLFGMADSISFYKDKSERDLAACLKFYTHVVVKNGLAIAP